MKSELENSVLGHNNGQSHGNAAVLDTHAQSSQAARGFDQAAQIILGSLEDHQQTLQSSQSQQQEQSLISIQTTVPREQSEHAQLQEQQQLSQEISIEHGDPIAQQTTEQAHLKSQMPNDASTSTNQLQRSAQLPLQIVLHQSSSDQQQQQQQSPLQSVNASHERLVQVNQLKTFQQNLKGESSITSIPAKEVRIENRFILLQFLIILFVLL